MALYPAFHPVNRAKIVKLISSLLLDRALYYYTPFYSRTSIIRTRRDLSKKSG